MNELPPPAAPRPDCPDCRGRGLRFVREGELARAVPCACIGPCPRCQDTFLVRTDAGGAQRVLRCRCRLLPDRADLFDRIGIPAHYATADFVSFSQGALKMKAAHGDDAATEKLGPFSRVYAWANAYDPTRENRGLVLTGKVGRGKTHLLVALLRHLALEKGLRTRFIEFTRLLADLRAGFDEGRSGAEVLNRLVEVPVLAIDELGKGRMTDWELSVVDELISRRYNALRCTLGTTNFPPGEPTGALPANLALGEGAARQTLGDRIGERPWSRLNEMVDFIEVGGPDVREVKRTLPL